MKLTKEQEKMFKQGYEEAEFCIRLYGWDYAATYFEMCSEDYQDVVSSRWSDFDFIDGFMYRLDCECK